MNTDPEIDLETFEVEDSDDLIALAKTLVDGNHPGILCTVDHEGAPRARWMSTLDFHHFPVFYSLTAPGSRKVAQITEHPAVNWMFFKSDRSLILNLIGKARVLTDVPTLKQVWQEVEEKSQTYFLDQFGKGPGFVVIETTVESIECDAPPHGIRFKMHPAEFTRV